MADDRLDAVVLGRKLRDKAFKLLGVLHELAVDLLESQ